MKCDNCKYRKFHRASSWYAVAEGNDDPYNYEYCDKGYWTGDDLDYDKREDILNDKWEYCTDFKESPQK